MTEQAYKALKEQHDAAQEAASEAKGALKNLQARLKNEFGLKSAAEARVRLKEMAAQKAKLEKQVNAAVAKYKQEFPNDQD